MPAKAVRKAALLAALTFFLAPAFPQKKALQIQTKKIPQINSTKTGDKDFMLKQFDDELLQNRQLYSKGEPVAPAFYAYTAGEDDKLLDLAARFCLRYDSFCPLNGIYGADADIKGRRLALPTLDGLFVPLEANENSDALEILLQKNRADLLEDKSLLRYNVDGKIYVFFPGQKFSTTERAFFLDTTLRLPVKNYRISSRYGQRDNPFGGGKVQFHRGVDMAVPEGSSVFACKGGTVLGTGQNRIYGKWIQIDHGRGMTSFYAHLSLVQDGIKKGTLVRAGDLIAKSGSTGQVTGPHLHFEIRVNGNAVDPEAYGNF